jgi:beta-xylosidase
MTEARSTEPAPVLGGFHPDPTVCRVGDDYYLACSSFAYFPGVPVYHSRDLVSWRQIGNALDRPAQLALDGAPVSGGVYAPTLRHHDGRFWLVTTNVSDKGSFIVTADDPTGPWSDPVWLPGVPGIDPDLAWDDAGTCWCTYQGIAQVRIDPHTGAALDAPRPLWSGSPGAQWPEGPHLYRVGDYWYLLIAEGGTERGHCVSVARGPAPDGPFEPCPANPILTARSTARPVQSTGHGDLVQAVDGSWWLLFLGVRVRGGTPGHHVLGRETFLAPVTWSADGWPVVGEIVSGVGGPARERDGFDDAALHPRWISPWSRPSLRLGDPPGWLTLHARAGSLDHPAVALVARRPAHLAWTGRTRVDAADGTGGLVLRMDERHHYAIEVRDGQAAAWARIGPVRQRFGVHDLPPGPAVLRIEVGPVDEAAVPHGDAPDAGPDVVRLGVEAGDDFVVLGELDGRYLSTEVAGGFVGRVVGMYAVAGTVRFDWFDYTADDRPADDLPAVDRTGVA